MIPLPRIEASPRILPMNKSLAEPPNSGRAYPNPPSREPTWVCERIEADYRRSVEGALITKEKT